MQQEIRIGFTYDRDTKRMYRFREDAEEPLMGSLYVSKRALEQRPARIEVTLRVLE